MKKSILLFVVIVFALILSLFVFYLRQPFLGDTDLVFDARIVGDVDANTSINNSGYLILEPLEVAKILSRRDSYDLSGGGRVVIRVTGDVAPVRVADIKLREKGMSYGFDGQGIRQLLSESDYTLVNLETPLISNCPARNVGMIFCGMSGFATAMKEAGVDIVGLANNHSLNYGRDGLEQTVRYLREQGLVPLGFSEDYIFSDGGMTFGILALNGVGSQIDRKEVARQIAELKLKVDVIIVSIHWGAEYTLLPQRAAGVAPDDTVKLGRWLVNQGVDLVVGHHPHVVQGIEVYNEKLIVYSHGNFLFDQEWSRETKEGVVGTYVFEGGYLVDAYFTPVIIEDWVRPRVADEDDAENIFRRMRESSKEIKGL